MRGRERGGARRGVWDRWWLRRVFVVERVGGVVVRIVRVRREVWVVREIMVDFWVDVGGLLRERR